MRLMNESFLLIEQNVSIPTVAKLKGLEVNCLKYQYGKWKLFGNNEEELEKAALARE